MSLNERENGYSDDEMDFDETEFDEDYFDRTYRPLSNLPTPPPSSWDASDACSPGALLEDGELLGSVLLGPAIHLVNLVPPAASLASPTIPAVHELLTRASLPLETIALAVCILDSLNSKFSLNWRLVCPLAPFESSPAHPKRHTLPATIQASDQLHIDSVRPELIILASLVIAVKFLDDCQKPTKYYASCWGRDVWTCGQINATERCIMESLGHRILPLWDTELIKDALGDMGRAARQANLLATDDARRETDDPHRRTMSSGTAIASVSRRDDGGGACHFVPITPADTPDSEVPPGEPATHVVSETVRAAFIRASVPLSRDALRPPPRGKRRPTPSAFGDPIS